MTTQPRRYHLVTEGHLEPAAQGQWFKQEEAQWVANHLNGLSRTPHKYRVEEVTPRQSRVEKERKP